MFALSRNPTGQGTQSPAPPYSVAMRAFQGGNLFQACVNYSNQISKHVRDEEAKLLEAKGKKEYLQLERKKKEKEYARRVATIQRGEEKLKDAAFWLASADRQYPYLGPRLYSNVPKPKKKKKKPFDEEEEEEEKEGGEIKVNYIDEVRNYQTARRCFLAFN